MKVVADKGMVRFVVPPYLAKKTSHRPLHPVEGMECGRVVQALMPLGMDLARRWDVCRSWRAQGRVRGSLTGCMRYDVVVEGEEEETARQLDGDSVKEHGNTDADSAKEHENTDAGSERGHENTDVAVQGELEKVSASHMGSERELENIGVAVQGELEKGFVNHMGSERELGNIGVAVQAEQERASAHRMDSGKVHENSNGVP